MAKWVFLNSLMSDHKNCSAWVKFNTSKPTAYFYCVGKCGANERNFHTVIAKTAKWLWLIQTSSARCICYKSQNGETIDWSKWAESSNERGKTVMGNLVKGWLFKISSLRLGNQHILSKHPAKVASNIICFLFWNQTVFPFKCQSFVSQSGRKDNIIDGVSRLETVKERRELVTISEWK